LNWDAIIIGAGAAGLFCAGIAGQRGLRVLVIDHSAVVAEKIRISGGGRCNFTNRELDARSAHRHFISDNPSFCRSALSRYTPHDFMHLLSQYRIHFHEKHKGQLFCDEGSHVIIDMLLDECAAGRVERWQPCSIEAIRTISSADDKNTHFELDTHQGSVKARKLVIATGGLSIPKIGATDFGYRIAKQFGHKLIEPRPALVPLTFSNDQWELFSPLAGISIPVRVSTGAGKTRPQFDEDLLFTHRGLSGPGILQISSYWNSGEALSVDLLPDTEVESGLTELKSSSRKKLSTHMSDWFPQRLADAITAPFGIADRPINEIADKALRQLSERIQRWQVYPSGSEGFKKAEVTRGGVDTKELSSQTMESLRQPGLHFIGEVIDVTGWLGGYNFQWAWSSAHACALAL